MLTTNLVPAVETAQMENPKKNRKTEVDIKDEEDIDSETDSESDDTMHF